MISEKVYGTSSCMKCIHITCVDGWLVTAVMLMYDNFKNNEKFCLATCREELPWEQMVADNVVYLYEVWKC